MRKIRLSQLFLLVLVFVFSNSYAVLCQDAQIVQTNEKLIIKSKALNEERSVLIRLPSNYAQRSEKYPIVYMLDGQAPHINLMTGTIEHLVWSDLAPEMILVSIPNTIRVRDMTPTVVESRAGSGGADKFLQFIETELIPVVEKKYRVQPYRIFAGHSLAGLFVTYSFISRPELFNAYIAASPFLHWDNNLVIKRGEELLKQKKELKRTLFFALGDEPLYMDGFKGFKEMITRLQIQKLDYEMPQMPEENHSSILAGVFQKGLRKVWSGWQMPQLVTRAEFSLADLENHYKFLTDKYDYEILIPESLLNSFGYRLLRDGKIEEAIKVFEKTTALYPNSANAYDSLAEGLEAKGMLGTAKENLEKALKLAERNGETQLIATIKENLKRVTGKLAQTSTK